MHDCERFVAEIAISSAGPQEWDPISELEVITTLYFPELKIVIQGHGQWVHLGEQLRGVCRQGVAGRDRCQKENRRKLHRYHGKGTGARCQCNREMREL